MNATISSNAAFGTATATAKARPTLDHVIPSVVGDKAGPTLIVIGSLHGNETAGTKALERVATQLDALAGQIRGRVYLLAGNTRACVERARTHACAATAGFEVKPTMFPGSS